MCISPVVRQIPEVASLLANADYYDEKVATGTVSMREFVANMLNYQPAWIACLYGVRGVFVRLLGMRQERRRRSPRLQPATLPMTSGARASLFVVRAAVDERYWIGEAADRHLTAVLVIVVESLDKARKRFHVVTIVHYRNWAGPLYFHVIQPFHHLVVGSMTRAGIHPASPQKDEKLIKERLPFSEK